LLDDYSGIDALRFGEAPDPVPARGEVVLALDFAGLNPADRYLAEKQYPARPVFPHILGRDGMGTVVECGSECGGIKEGDRFLIMRSSVGGDRPGTFAEKVAVPVDSLAPVPEGWTAEEAGGASLVYLTAWQALTTWGPLPENAIVLVTGASGGVGIASLQLGVALGLRVIGLSRSIEKRARLEQVGAWLTFDPYDPGWRRKAKERLDPERVALAIDNVGGKLLQEVIDTLGFGGSVSLVGRLAGPVPNFNTATLFFRRLRMGGVAVGTYTPAESRAAWNEVLHALTRNNSRPVVDSVFGFEQLPQAFERLASGPMGKVLLRVARA
jgi:NADPH:quinone reductase